jgi:hypothetical protein
VLFCSRFVEVVANGRFTRYLLQESGDRVNLLIHHSHPEKNRKQVGLREGAGDWDIQVLIQCRDDRSATFFRLRTLSFLLGDLPPLGERHGITCNLYKSFAFVPIFHYNT